jgi:hypothetical protein
MGFPQESYNQLGKEEEEEEEASEMAERPFTMKTFTYAMKWIGANTKVQNKSRG